MSRVNFHDTALEAVTGISSGATVMVSGFGTAGQPVQLIEALLDGSATDLTIVSNNAGGGDFGLAALIREGRVRKVVCSFPRQVDSYHFDEAYRAGRLEDVEYIRNSQRGILLINTEDPAVSRKVRWRSAARRSSPEVAASNPEAHGGPRRRRRAR